MQGVYLDLIASVVGLRNRRTRAGYDIGAENVLESFGRMMVDYMSDSRAGLASEMGPRRRRKMCIFDFETEEMEFCCCCVVLSLSQRYIG
jgi:hypothetical protein